MSEIESYCPYCDNKEFIEIENMGDGDEGYEYCQSCKKKYRFWVSYSVDVYTNQLSKEERR